MKRILLGTAQLSGFPYGNLRRGLTRAESFAILDAAWALGIRAFDTAESYGAAADRLESWLAQQPRPDALVTTKVTPGGGFAVRAYGARSRFWPWLDVLYLHGLPHSAYVWESLEDCSQGRAGASIYTEDDARVVRAVGTPQHWQVPLALYRTATFAEPCDVRSVFAGGADVYTPTQQIADALARLRPEDRLVIGVDTPKQLEAIAAACAPSR